MITPHNYYSQLDGFYKIGKTFTVGDAVPESVTVFDLGSSQYEHKAIIIDPLSASPDVDFKFYDPTAPGGISPNWFTIAVQLNTTNFLSCVIPVRVAQIRVTNPPAGGGLHTIQVSLLN
jgi:hypothetical protein